MSLLYLLPMLLLYTHCSPVAFTRYIVLPGWLQRAVNDRPYGVVNFVVAIFRDDVVFPAGL